MKSRYDSVEFGTLKYMATSGGISCPDSDARISYNNLTGYPTAWFNGTTAVVGAGTDAASGSTYDPVVLSMLDDATPVKMTITDFSVTEPAFVTVEVELVGNLDGIDGHYIRGFVLENGLTYQGTDYEDILCDFEETPLTISQQGETQTVTIPFGFAATGGRAPEDFGNCWIAAMVQRDSDHHVYQSTMSYPTPDYAFRYFCLGERVQIGDIGGGISFDDFAVFNTGTQADDISISLDPGELPAGWDAWFTDGAEVFTSTSVHLEPGENATFNVVIEPAATGFGTAAITLSSPNARTDDRRFGYSVITSDIKVLVVDDDGSESYEDYFTDALDTTPRAYAVWDRNAAAVSADILGNFEAVIWNVGWSFPSLDADDRAALGEYLDGGGSLFASGQDIGWDLHDEGGAAYQWYQDYLHAIYVADDTNLYNLDGVAGDPITDGMSITISGGDGANNQQYPSDIDPADAFASAIFTYNSYRNGAVRADTGTYRVVYTAFGYEAINNAADRAALMQGIINWLIPDLSGAPDEAPAAAVILHQNLPNPFNPKTVISFQLARSGAARLTVHDATGRLVRVLADGHCAAGAQTFVWDGRDKGGNRLSSGLYFYRLEAAGETISRKMLMLK